MLENHIFKKKKKIQAETTEKHLASKALLRNYLHNVLPTGRLLLIHPLQFARLGSLNKDRIEMYNKGNTVSTMTSLIFFSITTFKHLLSLQQMHQTSGPTCVAISVIKSQERDSS